MKSLSIILVLVSFAILVFGTMSANGAPQEAVFAATACYIAILARIAQAESHHYASLQIEFLGKRKLALKNSLKFLKPRWSNYVFPIVIASAISLPYYIYEMVTRRNTITYTSKGAVWIRESTLNESLVLFSLSLIVSGVFLFALRSWLFAGSANSKLGEKST